MPVTWQKTNSLFSIIVWESTEALSELSSNLILSENEITELISFKSETRKREWLTVRNILKVLLPASSRQPIVYDSYGRPTLFGGYSISISHTGVLVAVMISNAQSIGIDIEHIHNRIQKLSIKFLNDEEKKIITNTNILQTLNVIWGAKEVLYKIHSIGGIDFKLDLMVHPFLFNHTGQLKASIVKKGYEKDYRVDYEEVDGYILTYSSGVDS